MSNLVTHAERELRYAGWFDKDSDYGGSVGPAVVQLVREFATEGHSGGSAPLVVQLFERVARFQLLSPMPNPMDAGEYTDCSDISGYPVFQSTRLHSLFSEDGGQRWYDIDKRPSRWQQLLRRLHLRDHRVYVSFPYMP